MYESFIGLRLTKKTKTLIKYRNLFWVTYIPKSSTKPQPTNLNNRKSQRAQYFSQKNDFWNQNRKIRGKFLQPWNSNRPSTNISNLESRDTSTHGGETEQTNLPQRFAIREPF